MQTRSYRRPRFDPVKPCLACGDECSVVLPGYSSMSVWEEIGVKRLRVQGRGNGGGIRRAYFCKRCRHVFTGVGWYHDAGRFPGPPPPGCRQFSTPVIMKRRSV